jgi:DNA-3-methyladenine glycosylase
MNMESSFYEQSTQEIARALVGCHLHHLTAEGEVSGMILETEAYLSTGDPASHSRNGMTKRNAPMFGNSGTAYIYQIYGLHLCFNVVTARQGCGEAVLIRMLKPTWGLEIMKANRGIDDMARLCNGPGNLTASMGISFLDQGNYLLQPPLWISPRTQASATLQIVTLPRIGIAQGTELPLRFRSSDIPRHA